MKALCTFFLLALIPTFLFSNYSRSGDLHGLWYDNYTNTEIEIKHSRKGIRVKERGGWFRKWRTYNYMGRGLYDDCDGRVIVVLGRNRIEWRHGRRGRRVVLTRYDDYGYNDYRPNNNYNNDWSYDQRDRRGRGRSGRFGPRDYTGNWFCQDRGLNLTIQLSGNGFRARSGRDWVYYEPYRDHYRDRRGNRYYLNDRGLTWQSRDGRKELRFGRR